MSQASGKAALAGKTYLVTGANGGFGDAMARACASAGADVILLGRRVPKLTRLHDAISASGTGSASIYPLDLAGATPDDYTTMAEAIEGEYGRLDGIIHAAAEFKGLASLQNMPLEDWFTGMHVNLTAPFLLTRACIPTLRKAGEAQVLFLLDDPRRTTQAFWGPYGVAKQALRGLVDILGEELENSGIQVRGVQPGPMRTALRAQAFFAEDPASITPASAYVPACLALLTGTTRNAPRFVTLTASDSRPRDLGLATFVH